MPFNELGQLKYKSFIVQSIRYSRINHGNIELRTKSRLPFKFNLLKLM